jgi:DNA-directed RNA polymerase specialized sigma subunit
MNRYEKEKIIIEWLKEYKYIKASIAYLEESILDIIESGFGLSYDKVMTSKTNKLTSIVENSVILIDKQEINAKIKAMRNIITAVDAALACLNETERTVIVKRCVDNQCYFQFIHTINVSERTARRVKKESLNKMSIIVFGK